MPECAGPCRYGDIHATTSTERVAATLIMFTGAQARSSLAFHLRIIPHHCDLADVVQRGTMLFELACYADPQDGPASRAAADLAQLVRRYMLLR